MNLLEHKILQHVHESWRKTLSGPQKRTCDVLGELGRELPLGEQAMLATTLDVLVSRGWLTKHADDFYEATDRGEAALFTTEQRASTG